MSFPPATTITAEALASALTCGIHRVIAEQETLNRINVFPVADGDTGTNLSLSLGAALQLLHRPATPHLGALLTSLADTLLDSARGNSGAIMAQFFQGMSDSAESLSAFTAETFTRAVSRGSEYAHDALAEPREGTILSVIAAFERGLRRAPADPQAAGVAGLLPAAVALSQRALARTEEQLDVLRKAGVVDAGARGFVALVEGVADFLVHGKKTERPAAAETLIAPAMDAAGADGALTYRYCTECVVNGDDIDRRKLREQLSALGDSLVLAGTKKKAKVHVHVNDPDAVFALARRYGELSGIKADDMQRQQKSAHTAGTHFAVITDSAADIADEDLEQYDIHIVPCRIQFGDRGYLDKVSITTREFFDELANNPCHPTTSQPSPGDFRRQYQHLASHFPNVISVNLSDAVSGTLQAAQSAAARSGDRVHVVNSQNASVGQGLLAVYAAECAQAGLDAAAALRAIAAMVPVTTSYGLLRHLGYAVRGGRLPAWVRVAAEALHVSPVIRTFADGRVSAGGVLPGRRALVPKFARFVARRCRGHKDLRLAIGHAICPEDAENLKTLLLELLPNARSCAVTGLGSAIGAHGGPGSLVVAVQEYRDPREMPD